MIVKALLAWAGLKAAPHFHDPRVHDALSADAAVMSGVRVVAREARGIARAIAADPSDAGTIDRGMDRMRETVEELIRRTR